MAIEIKNINKSFHGRGLDHDIKVLDDVNLNIGLYVSPPVMIVLEILEPTIVIELFNNIPDAEYVPSNRVTHPKVLT